MYLLPRKRPTPPRDARFVAEGRVACPIAHDDIDVERCISCPWLRATGLSAATPWVRCAPPASLAMPRYSSVLSTGREREVTASRSG